MYVYLYDVEIYKLQIPLKNITKFIPPTVIAITFVVSHLLTLKSVPHSQKVREPLLFVKSSPHQFYKSPQF